MTARRLWRAVTGAFVVFAGGLVATLGLLFSTVTIASSASTGSESCGSPVSNLFSSSQPPTYDFGVPANGSVPSCTKQLTRRTAVAIDILLFAAVPLAVALLWALKWHLQSLAVLRG